MNKFTEYTLPEYVFLDGSSHEGDKLEGRTVMQHVRSATILEVFDLAELKAHAFTKPTYEFEYKNRFGVVEKHMFVVHWSLITELGDPDPEMLDNILESCAQWYCAYLAWEDGNIDGDHKAVHN